MDFDGRIRRWDSVDAARRLLAAAVLARVSIEELIITPSVCKILEAIAARNGRLLESISAVESLVFRDHLFEGLTFLQHLEVSGAALGSEWASMLQGTKQIIYLARSKA